MSFKARGEIIRLAAAESLGTPKDYEKPLEKIAQIEGIPNTPKSISMSATLIFREAEEFYRSNKLGLYQPDIGKIQDVLKSTYEIEKNQGKIQWIK